MIRKCSSEQQQYDRLIWNPQAIVSPKQTLVAIMMEASFYDQIDHEKCAKQIQKFRPLNV